MNLANRDYTIFNPSLQPQLTPALTFEEKLFGLTLASPLTHLYLATEIDKLSLARETVLNIDNWQVAATELWGFNARPRGIDQSTEDVWEAPAQAEPFGGVTLVFNQSNDFLDSLQAGELLVEDPGVNLLITPAWDNPFNPHDDDPPKTIADYLPLEVESVSHIGEKVYVTGRKRLLLEVVKSATFVQDASTSPYDDPVRDPYVPNLENTYTNAEQEDRDETAGIIEAADPRDGRLADLKGMTASPWHFNRLQVSPKIFVTGEVFIRSSGLHLEIKIRNFEVDRAVAHIDAGVVMNLVMECEGSEDTSLIAEEQKTAHLFNVTLPGGTDR